jgi:hypothetical protein
MRKLFTRLVPLVVVITAFVAAFEGPASAAETVTRHFDTDVAGSGVTITCGELSLTPVSGTLHGVFHENADERGSYHYSGTNVADHVVLTDGDAGSYRLQGTSSFSGTSSDPGGEDNRVFSTTVAFVLLDSRGGRIGRVHLVEHFSTGSDVLLESGSCVGIGGEG